MGQVIYHLEGSLLHSHQRSPLCGRLSGGACPPYSASGMDLRHGTDVVRVVFALNYIAAQRETLATPWTSDYGDMSSPSSFRVGAGFYSQLAWFWPVRLLFFLFRYI
jgi:hypothetical protein